MYSVVIHTTPVLSCFLMFLSYALERRLLQRMQSLWPYHSYRPVSWDKYYVNEQHEKQTSVTKTVAEGVTICVFLLVFLFTFGCRIYAQYAERNGQPATPRNTEAALSQTLAEDMWICGVPREPPPPYEVAIKMPTALPPPPPSPS